MGRFSCLHFLHILVFSLDIGFPGSVLRKLIEGQKYRLKRSVLISCFTAKVLFETGKGYRLATSSKPVCLHISMNMSSLSEWKACPARGMDAMFNFKQFVAEQGNRRMF